MIILTALSLPFMRRAPLDLPPIVSVELIQIGDKTNLPFAPKAKKIIEKIKKEKDKLVSEQAPPKKVKKENPKAVPTPDQKMEKIDEAKSEAIPLPEKKAQKVKMTEEKKQNPTKEDTKIKQVSEFEKEEIIDPNKIAALIDKSKEEMAETTKTTNKKVFGNSSTNNLIDEHHPLLTFTQGLKFQPNVTILTAPTRLTNEFTFNFTNFFNCLAVSDLRLSNICLYTKLPTHSVYNNIKMQLTHPRNYSLTSLFISFDTKRRILLSQLT